MRSNELKAVLAKTREVAIYPTNIEGAIPPYLERRNGLAVCPRGLVQANVIETGVAWVERRPVAECGDQEYDVPHRNGILVELDADGFAVSGHTVFFLTREGKRSKTKVPHTHVVTRQGQKYVQMIVSHRAIIAPWGEYALIEAQREKDEAEREAKAKRLTDALTAIMGVGPEKCRDLSLNGDYVQHYDYAENGDYKRDADGRRILKYEQGRIQITVERAEEILATLTPKQKKTLGITP